MCNIAKLKGKIAEKGLNQVILAKEAGMDKSTLSRKMKSGEAFTIGEANKIAIILKLTKEEAMNIFFDNIVA
ncbi:MAG: helix-turn-helix transcriptional regulator [Firmicutes bacterium]|nr:helix-turn-helix transcriptional regulator [Bacillota bacterium]